MTFPLPHFLFRQCMHTYLSLGRCSDGRLFASRLSFHRLYHPSTATQWQDKMDSPPSCCICFFNALFSAAAPSDQTTLLTILWVIHHSWDQLPFYILNVIYISLCVLYSIIWFSRRLARFIWQATSKCIKMYCIFHAGLMVTIVIYSSKAVCPQLFSYAKQSVFYIYLCSCQGLFGNLSKLTYLNWPKKIVWFDKKYIHIFVENKQPTGLRTGVILVWTSKLPTWVSCDTLTPPVATESLWKLVDCWNSKK